MTELEAVKAERDRMLDALIWIENVARKEYENDEKLRSQGARTFSRIGDRARAAISDQVKGEAPSGSSLNEYIENVFVPSILTTANEG